MGTITYQNIQLSGIEYDKLLALSITHSANEHAYAQVVFEIDTKIGNEFVNRVGTEKAVTISTSAQGQHNTLFCGVVSNVAIETTSEYSVIRLTLASTSRKLDAKKNSKTFQNTSMTYEQVLISALNGTGYVNIHVTDKPIGTFIMQYKETDWEFIKRMASQLQASVFVNIETAKPVIHLGLPDAQETVELKTVQYSQGIDTKSMQSMSQIGQTNMLAQDYGAQVIKTDQYCYLGEKILVNGTSYRVANIRSELSDGILKSTYAVSTKNSFTQAPSFNQKSSGKMFTGTVQAVKGDKVQVFFAGMDSSYDGGGTQWFPYSTAYSSSDGSGFYCMPEVGDTVRIFMPSDNEKDAFAASSVNTNPQANTKDKSWKAPGGKEILLTDDGIYIVCEKEKIFINLTKKDGIQIVSNQNIEISSDTGIVIKAGEKIEIEAEESINLGVGNSNIYMDKEQVILGADKVYIN